MEINTSLINTSRYKDNLITDFKDLWKVYQRIAITSPTAHYYNEFIDFADMTSEANKVFNMSLVNNKNRY